MQDWQLFEVKIHTVDGKPKAVGFNAPDGKYYPLEADEELVHIKREDDRGRNTFIRKMERMFRLKHGKVINNFNMSKFKPTGEQHGPTESDKFFKRSRGTRKANN